MSSTAAFAARRIDSQHADLAAVTAAVSFQDLDDRRLAGAVVAEQRIDLALLDVERNAAHCRQFAVRLAQTANLDRGHGNAIRNCERASASERVADNCAGKWRGRGTQ